MAAVERPVYNPKADLGPADREGPIRVDVSHSGKLTVYALPVVPI